MTGAIKMISVCVVLYAGASVFIKTLLESITLRCKHVTEVLIAHVDATDYYEKTWVENNIEFKQFGHPLLKIWADRSWNALGNGHAFGMHACFEKAKSEYLMLVDPDVFFYIPIDEFYLNLIEKHKIDYIGISHHAAMTQAFTWFPCITNCMFKKSSLPDEDFLKGHIRMVNALHIKNLEDHAENKDAEVMNGYWMLQGPIEGFYDKFPNKDLSNNFGLFDVGCNLYLWALEKNWRWLSFQTLDCHLYLNIYNRGNFGFKEKLKKQKMLYHLISGARGIESGDTLTIENFFKEFEESKQE
jgi:hypothetical protein